MQLTQAINKFAIETPKAIATVYRGRRTSFDTFRNRVARFAGGLNGLGVLPGDRVGILALNSDRYLEFLFGTFWASAVINPVNIRWSVDEIAYSLNDCNTCVLVVDENFINLIPELRAKCPGLRAVINLGESSDMPGTEAYEAWLDRSDAIDDTAGGGKQLAAILYTGGTTGVPKGVMLSHENLLANALSALAAAPRPSISSALHAAPMFHVGGLAAILQTMLRGATHVVLPQFDSTEFLTTISKECVNETFLVPTMLQRILDDPEFSQHDVSQVKNIIYGAAPIDSSLLRRAISAFPNSQFMQVYGMTEVGPVAAILPPFYHTIEGQTFNKLKAAGRPTPACEINIIDPDGKILPHGIPGEIIIRGPTVMLGYWNKPLETSLAVQNGWIHTGDGGYFDQDGILHMADRIKDMIVTGGENVYSTEVENALLSYPGIKMCAVVGIPNEQWGESVHAILLLLPGTTLDTNAIKVHCKTLIAGYKCPTSFEVRESLPLSAAGKILKHELRASYWTK